MRSGHFKSWLSMLVVVQDEAVSAPWPDVLESSMHYPKVGRASGHQTRSPRCVCAWSFAEKGTPECSTLPLVLLHNAIPPAGPVQLFHSATCWLLFCLDFATSAGDRLPHPRAGFAFSLHSGCEFYASSDASLRHCELMSTPTPPCPARLDAMMDSS